MQVKPGELMTQVRYSMESYDRLQALRYLADQRDVVSLTRRLIDMSLVESQEAIPVPAQLGRAHPPTKAVFTHLKGPTATAILEGSEKHGLKHAAFIRHIVDHSLGKVVQEIPEIDTLIAIADSKSMHDRCEPYTYHDSLHLSLADPRV